MTVEAPKPQGEQPKDPVQETRRAFNRELLGKEYTSGVLLDRVVELQNALLGSKVLPDKLYPELRLVAGQAADRAEVFEDNASADRLRTLQKGYELTLENLTTQPESTARPIQPTRTENLPMTSAKGVQAPTEKKPQPQRQPKTESSELTSATSPAETSIITETSSTTSQEGKLTASETQKPQSPQKKRGRPPKSTQ